MKRLLLNEVEVCNLLDIKPRTLSFAEIPKVVIGKLVLYDVDDIIEWLRSSERSGATLPELVETYSDDEEIEGISNLALALGVPYRFAFYRVKKNQIPYERKNGGFVFSIKALKNWIREKKKYA